MATRCVCVRGSVRGSVMEAGDRKSAATGISSVAAGWFKVEKQLCHLNTFSVQKV